MNHHNHLTPPTFHDGAVDQFIACRVCARCYGDLAKRNAPDYSPENHNYEIYCPTCGDAWHYATVSKTYAEKLGQQAIAANWEIKANLPDLFPNPHHGKPAEQIIHELGY